MQTLSLRTHTIIGTLIGVALLIAPNLFRFSDVGGVSVDIPRIFGIIIIFIELIAKGSYRTLGFVPMSWHIIVDVVIGIFLAASPWLYDFSDEEINAWLPHLVVGIVIIGYALMTRSTKDEYVVH